MSNCTVGLFLGTKLAQFPLRPRWSQQKKRSLNSVPELAARPPPSPRVHKTIPYCNRKQHPPVSRLSSKWPIFRFWVQYTYFWLSPSGKQRQILALGPKRVQCTLSTRHKWPVKNAVVNLPIRLKGNSANSLSPFEAQNKDMGFVAQTLLTRIRLRLQRKHAFN